MKNFQPRVQYPGKTLIHLEGRTKNILDKKELTLFALTKPSLNELLRDVLQDPTPSCNNNLGTQYNSTTTLFVNDLPICQ